MRRIFALGLFLAVFCYASTAEATPPPSQTCALDKPLAGFAQCPFGDSDNDLLNQGYNSARLDTDITLSGTPIWVHGACAYVDARGTSGPLFIPFNSATEWEAFLNAGTPGVNIAECCTPRALDVSDIPDPVAACSSGWNFEGLVDPNDNSRLIAKPNAGGTFTYVHGYGEKAGYPISRLPIQRDDIGAKQPSGAHAGEAYVAKFTCTGMVSPGASHSGGPFNFGAGGGGNINLTTAEGNGTEGENRSSYGRSAKSGSSGVHEHFVGFHMQCVNNDWAHTSPTCFGETRDIIVEACPNGADGKVVKAVIKQCDGTTATEVISNTCGEVCPPKTVTIEDRACPSGQTGKITVEVTKYCFGRKPVGGQTGGSCDCTTVEKIIGDTCDTCPPETDLGTYEKSCPPGQTGKIVIRKKKICVLNDDGCGNVTCDCHVEETVESDTCRAHCPPYTDLGTTYEACPAGYHGSIAVHTVRICHEICTDGIHYQCVCHDQVTRTNNCVLIPPPTLPPDDDDWWFWFVGFDIDLFGWDWYDDWVWDDGGWGDDCWDCFGF